LIARPTSTYHAVIYNVWNVRLVVGRPGFSRRVRSKH